MNEQEIQERVNQELQKIFSDPRKAVRLYHEALRESEAEIELLNKRIDNELMPKAQSFDLLMDSTRLFEMSAAAKSINIRNMGRNNLFEYLKSKGVLRYNNEPYQQYVEAGYFKIVPEPFSKNGYEGHYNKTMVTAKGVNYIGKMLSEDGYAPNAR